MKNKFKNTRNEHLECIYRDTNLILSLKQPKNLYRELTSSRFIPNFKNIRKNYKCRDKRCKINQNYLNETCKFTMSNGQVWEIRREINWHSVNAIFYLKCKMGNEKETYIGKTIIDNTKWFKVRINQHISDCKTGDSTCKFPRHVYDCVVKNNCLEESFFILNIMLRLNKSERLENITSQILINLLSSISLKENLSDYWKHADEKFWKSSVMIYLLFIFIWNLHKLQKFHLHKYSHWL